MTTRELFDDVLRAEALVRELATAEEAAIADFGEASFEAWEAAEKLRAAETAVTHARRAHARAAFGNALGMAGG